jgi:hypothetical protein
MNQPISKEMRASPVGATNFEIIITQEMSAKEGADPHHSFALPHLSAAVTAFSLRHVYLDRDYDYFGDDDDDQDSGDNTVDIDEDAEESQLKLTYLVTYNVLLEMDNALPLPDDSEMVVRVEYKSDEGTPLFYHEFRGIFQMSTDVSGDRTTEGSLSMPLTMICWSWSLFNLCNSLVRK